MSGQHEWENTGNEVSLGQDKILLRVKCKVCTTRGAIVILGASEKRDEELKLARKDLAKLFPVCQPGQAQT